MKKFLTTTLMSLPVAALVAAGSSTNYAKLDKQELTPFQSGLIASAAGNVLQMSHYLQKPFNDEVSRAMFTNYLNGLDYNHMIFLQSDVDALAAKYADHLDEMTLKGETEPAYVIYDLFKKRLDERYEYIQKLIKQDFDYTKDEYFELQRHKMPWPATAAEADDLWRRRIKQDFLVGRLNKDKAEDTLDVVSKRYRRLEKMLTEFDREEVLGIYLNALGNAFDPHTSYMTPSERRNFDIHSIKNELTGIGAMLQNVDGYCTIKSLTPGGPAELSKQIDPEDRIVAVAQGDGEWVDVVEEKLDKVVEIIRGPLGTKVRLEIIPAKSDSSVRKTVELVRDVIQIKASLPTSKLYIQQDDSGKDVRLGVINLPTFHEKAAEDVAKLITRLKQEKIDGLVLDLRRNGGGILDQAIQLTGLFIDQGPVVQVKNYMNRRLVLPDDNPGALYDGPLIVLVSHLSASASEIVAAALQDYGRAIVIGDQGTHGKGTVQTLLDLDNFLRPDQIDAPGSLKFTIQKFYRIAGGTTQKYGVIPDYSLPSTYDYLELGERYLPNAMEADEISKAAYTDLNRVKPYLAELIKESKERVSHDPEFKYLAEDIEKLKEQLADRRLSLNEKKRLQEKEESEKRMEARKKERSARVNHEDHIYEMDLEFVDQNKPLISVAEVKLKGAGKADADKKKPEAHEGLDDDAESADADSPVDPHLEEALHILADYIDLLQIQEDGKHVALSPASR